MSKKNYFEMQAHKGIVTIYILKDNWDNKKILNISL